MVSTKMSILFIKFSPSTLLLLLFLLTTAGCSGITGLIKRGGDQAFFTPIPEETLQAYRIGTPVRTQLQAVTAAQAWLRFFPSFRYIPPVVVVSAERLKYEDAKKNIAEPDQNYIYQVPPDMIVWFVVFYGDFQIIPGESHGTPFPAGSGCVSVVVNPGDGSVLRTSGVTKCGPPSENRSLPDKRILSTPHPNQAGTPENNTSVPYPLQLSPKPTYVPATPAVQSKLPGLKQIVLSKEDIPYSTDSLFSFFLDPEISPIDNSMELIDLCTINCVKEVWTDVDHRRGLVIVMVQFRDSSLARKKIEEALAYEIKTFGSSLSLGSINLTGLPQHSWIVASNGVRSLVSSRIELHTSWGPIVVILSEQGEFNIQEIPLDDYFLTLQKLAVLQLDKLKQAGYTEY